MADMIARLKVDSAEYDAKIQRAAKGIQALAKQCHDAGSVLNVLEDENREYIQSLGNMETVATTARGKLAELTSAFTDIRQVYNSLSNEEKNGEFGKELNKQLEVMKDRINGAKSELNDINSEINGGTSSALDQLASKFTINIDAMKLFGVGLQAAKGALDVVKDAFFASESNIDEWGRTVQSAEAAYNVFLQTLNSGNWSNFLTNLTSAVRGARDLYDALDRLGSVKSNNQAAIAIVQQQIAQLRLAKQQGQNVDAQLKAATAQLAQLQKQAVDAGKTAGSKMVSETIKNRFNAQGGNLAGSSAAAISDRLIKGGQAEFDRQKNIYNTLRNKGMTTKSDVITTQYGTSYQTAGSKQFDISLLTKEEQKQYKLAKAITEGETEIQKGISAYAQAVQEGTAVAREEFKGNRYALQGIGGKGGKGSNKEDVQYASDSIMAQEKEVARLTQLWKTSSEEMRDGYLKQLDEAKEKLAEMQGKGAGPDFDKMFPDMSAQNYNTGYAGSKQAKQDSMMQDFGMASESFAQSALSTDSINKYISETKSLFQQADFGSDLYNSLTERLQDISTMQAVLSGLIKGGVEGADLQAAAEMLKAKLLEGDISEDAWQEMLDKLNEKIENSDLKLTFNVDTKSIETAAEKEKKQTQEMAKEWNAAGNAIQAVGNAMNQIQDPAAKVLGTVAQAVATMALSYAQAAASPAVTGSGWGWIAFAATGLATMVSSINAIKQAAEGFADGGIVQGNTYSGDQIPAMLNAGEIVLNRAQSANLASQLEGTAGFGNLALETTLRGEDIRIALNNNGRRTGRGEYVQSNRR